MSVAGGGAAGQSQPPALTPGRFGPAVRGRGRSLMARRLGFAVATSMVLLLLAVTAAAGFLMVYTSRAVERVEVPSLVLPGHVDTDRDGETDTQLPELAEVLNVLVVGSDSRAGLSPEELAALGTADEDGERTDTIMLVTLDPRREQVGILSFPRDLLVTRCDGSRGKINAAYGIGERTPGGGPDCLVDTIQRFSGIPIHHFVQVDFVGFISVVDALGGVTMYLDQPMFDQDAGLDVPAGCITMDGRTALAFVRARKIDDDFGRIARQQRFIREVLREAVSLGTLVNPARVLQLVDAGASAVEADPGLDLGKMRRIAFSFRDLDPTRLDARTVPGTPRMLDGVSYVIAKEAEAEALFAAFRDGTIFPDNVGTAGPTLTIADVPPVTVLNGAGTAGLAAQGRDFLEERGFEVAAVDNADDYGQQTTQVVHPPDLAAEAQLVAQAFGGAELVPSGEDAPIQVVLGADFDAEALAGEQPPSLSGVTPPPAQSTPEPEPSPSFVAASEPEVTC